jgi:hypothetical protein
VSCFEVFLNCVNDLLMNDGEKSFYNDKIKSLSVNTYTQAVETLNSALEKRKVNNIQI